MKEQKDDLKRDLLSVYKKLGRIYTRREYDKIGRVSSRTVERAFGCWADALAYCNISDGDNERRTEKTRSTELAPGHKYTAEQIQFVLDNRLTHAKEYGDIAKAFSKKYGGTRTSEQMRHMFRSYANTAVVDNEGGVEAHPFTGFTHSHFSGVHRAAGKEKGRWFVTAASPISTFSEVKKKSGRDIGHNLFMPGFKAMQTWAAANGGGLVILPMRAHMPPLHGQPSYYDPRLHDFENIFANEFHFNENIRALDVHLNPQQIHPLTGLHRIRGGQPQIIVDGRIVPTRFNQSLIFAHAKQDFEPVATGNGTMARILFTTGAITLPEYRKERIGRIADEAHILGGLIVEIDDGEYWVRQVQFAADGSFCDIDGKKYRPDGRTVPVRAKAQRMGDLHGGMEKASVVEAQARLASVIKPEELYLEDVFDGSSISHHTENQRITRARRLPRFKSLEAELAYDKGLLEELSKKFAPAKFVILESNHHDHLVGDRGYLEQGRYIRDDSNFELAHRMVVEMLDGVNPLQKRLDPDGRFEWLKAEDDRYVEGVQMGAHGHLGVDGARGSPVQLEKAFGDGMIGHLHSPRILGRLMVVGHSSIERHGYNKGPSRWLSTAGLVWPGGQKQLVTIIQGRYCLDDKG